jgi:hypothetical protein
MTRRLSSSAGVAMLVNRTNVVAAMRRPSPLFWACRAQDDVIIGTCKQKDGINEQGRSQLRIV